MNENQTINCISGCLLHGFRVAPNLYYEADGHLVSYDDDDELLVSHRLCGQLGYRPHTSTVWMRMQCLSVRTDEFLTIGERS